MGDRTGRHDPTLAGRPAAHHVSIGKHTAYGHSGRSQYDRLRRSAEIGGPLPGEYSASGVATGWRLANQIDSGQLPITRRRTDQYRPLTWLGGRQYQSREAGRCVRLDQTSFRCVGSVTLTLPATTK